jgi:hypothetical protein
MVSKRRPHFSIILDGIADRKMYVVRWLFQRFSKNSYICCLKGMGRSEASFNLCFYSLSDGIDIVASWSLGMGISTHSGKNV